MNPARRHHGLVALTLAEAIESVATRSVRDSVLDAALRDARRPEVPERGPEILEFVAGPLRRALALQVGLETASEVLEQIAPILQRATSRPSQAPRPTPVIELRASKAPPDSAESEDDSGIFVSRRVVTAPAPESALPVVFLASRDADAAVEIAIRLGGRATVRIIDGILELVDALEEEDEGAERLVILDGERPSVQVPSMLTVTPELVGRAEVLLWRCGRTDQATLRDHAPFGSWAAPGTTIDDLADACLRALG